MLKTLTDVPQITSVERYMVIYAIPNMKKLKMYEKF